MNGPKVIRVGIGVTGEDLAPKKKPKKKYESKGGNAGSRAAAAMARFRKEGMKKGPG